LVCWFDPYGVRVSIRRKDVKKILIIGSAGRW